MKEVCGNPEIPQIPQEWYYAGMGVHMARISHKHTDITGEHKCRGTVRETKAAE